MKPLKNIRAFYTPVQPAVKQQDNNVCYTEFLPKTDLQSFIYCYWQLKTNQSLHEAFTYKAVADGCIDIYFNLSAPKESFVMGFSKTYTEFSLEQSFNYVGIRFLPTMFTQLFKINAAELSHQDTPLELVVPLLSNYIANRCNETLQPQEIQEILDIFFLNHLAKIPLEYDQRLHHSLNIILKNSGQLTFEKDLDTGISPRQLRRLFKFHIGDAPKAFSKVIRFQQILKTKPSRQSLRENKLFFDNGYYDQAHFIKEFKQFYGVTPSKAFSR